MLFRSQKNTHRHCSCALKHFLLLLYIPLYLEADEKGRDSLLAQPVTQTLKENMTVENYDVDVTKFDDKALGSTLNLSSTDVEKGAPKLNKGDKWKEQYRTEENSAGKSED